MINYLKSIYKNMSSNVIFIYAEFIRNFKHFNSSLPPLSWISHGGRGGAGYNAYTYFRSN